MDFIAQAKQKALELMGKVKQPSMGEVRQSEFEQGLGQRSVEEPQYATSEDKDSANLMRDFKRDMLTKGSDPGLADSLYFSGNWPSQEQIDKQNMIMDASMAGGTIRGVGKGVQLAKESFPMLGNVIKKFPAKDEIMAEINNLRKNMTPENVEKIKELSRQLYGKVTGG